MICNLTPLKLLYKTGMSSTLLCFLSKVGPRGLPSKKDSHNDPGIFWLYVPNTGGEGGFGSGL
jgi:hypothetical protein